MREQLYHLAVSLRPRQWLKNFALFAPLLFTNQLYSPLAFERTILGAAAFCLLSSANYIINDVLDAASDRAHPYKKFRPVARQLLPSSLVIRAAVALILVGFALSYAVNPALFLVALTFVALHQASYFVLRSVPIIDVLAIAAGYVLRVQAGVAATGAHISIWLFLSVLSFSLLLAIGKRRAELSILQAHQEKSGSELLRKFPYTEKLLDSYVAMFANTTFLSYAYFTFLAGPAGENSSMRTDPGFMNLIGRKWLMVTIPFVLYGVMRYLQLIYVGKKGTLEKVVLGDRALLLTAGLWTVAALVVTYGIQ